MTNKVAKAKYNALLNKYRNAVAIHVRRGVKFLAAEYGGRWYDNIHLDTLVLRDSTYCVFGQVDTDHYSGGEHRLQRIKGDYVDAGLYGFNLPNYVENGLEKLYYDSTLSLSENPFWFALQEEWNATILDLRLQDARREARKRTLQLHGK